ncbi:MAG: SpoIID/LytB domain-containing protein [Dermatophilaceae bacterium]
MPHARRPRALAALTVALVAPTVALAVAVPAPAAFAQSPASTAGLAGATRAPRVEIIPRPAGSSITFTGRGYGHGRGMSQWGANGAATSGVSWTDILGHYYPGTSRVWQGNPRIDVHLTQLGDSALTVAAAPGLQFSDGTATVSLPTSVRFWRVVPDGGGLTLQWQVGDTWVSSTGWRQWTRSSFSFSGRGSVRAVLPSGLLRDYRDVLRVHPSGSSVVTVNTVSTEAYLWSVVPSEMPALWEPDAVRAQAVAARSYATRDRVDSSSPLYDTCDTTACQVYHGIVDLTSSGAVSRRWEHPASTDAVSQTAGIVLHYRGYPAFTQFSASNGGMTVPGSQPYLVRMADPYDGAAGGSAHAWAAAMSIASVEAEFPSVGTLSAIEVLARDGVGQWGGRTTSVRVVGSAGSETVSGDTFRSRLGLRSTWWSVAP